MKNFVIITGDQVNFNPNFGTAVIVPQIGIMQGLGLSKILSKIICIVGDEKNIIIPGIAYTTTVGHTIPGSGILTIESLNDNQISKNTKSNAKALILKGTFFTAKFTVVIPASIPGSPPAPDPTVYYSGKGYFINKNTIVKAS